jgi:hypothetical protein
VYPAAVQLAVYVVMLLPPLLTGAVKPTCTLPGRAVTTTAVGAEGSVVPDWFTGKVLLAIVALPVRSEAVAFCVHDTVTDPEPLPLVGATVNQDPLPDALQVPP